MDSIKETKDDNSPLLDGTAKYGKDIVVDIESKYDKQVENTSRENVLLDKDDEFDEENQLIVAAIDFGTTFSGYAFSLTSDKNSIYVNKNWGQTQGFLLYKTPTSLLLNPDGEFVAFGFDAVSQYYDLSDDEAPEYYFFERFKMQLYNNKELNSELKIVDATGKEAFAVDVFAKSLAAMKSHLIKAVETHLGYVPEEKTIRWVITVPAIWDENAKQFMRETAYKAKLIRRKSSCQLLVALEPEAASLHCRSLPYSNYLRCYKESQPSFEPGTKYLVVDAGGGTIDVVAHKIRSDGRVKEILRASGGHWGGTMVDEQFKKLLLRIFGQDFITEFQNAYQKDYLEILQDFEIKKRGDGDIIRVTLPYNFCNFKRGDYTVPELIKNYAQRENVGVKFSSGRIVLTSDVLKYLFDDVMEQILSHVSELLNKTKLSDCQYIFVVGGFAECPRLQNELREKFKERATILVPEEASLAVVRGAVAFGHDPKSIGQRICRFTYGVGTYLPYDAGVHREDLKVEMNGQELCKNIFQVWAEVGEIIDYNELWTETYTPIVSNQQGIVFEFYRSRKRSVKYTDENGVVKCGELVIQMPVSDGDMNRSVDLAVRFGGTELEITAFDHTSKMQQCTYIDLLT